MGMGVGVGVGVGCGCAARDFSVLLVVIGRIAGAKVAGDSVEGLACDCTFEVVAGLHHIWQVIPCVGSGIPGDHAVARGEVDVASGK